MKKIVFVIALIFVILFFGKNLNPFSPTMFDFHDITQPARIEQFTLNLRAFKIPPRLAPDFSFKLGYPVFNFYAPTSYWIAGIIHILGIDVVNTVKLSFLLAVIIAFAGSYFFFTNFFSIQISVLSAILYVSSLYVPLSIFVRGNLGELWFIALFPLALYFLYANAQKKSKIVFMSTCFILSLTLTSHNLLSLISIPIFLVFILLQKHKKKNTVALVLAILLAGYFFLPLALENTLTYAREVATMTKYSDHFLCWWQLWQSPWGYGGSAPGCMNDGMSFKIGKLQVIFGVLGVLLFFLSLLKHKQKKISSILYSLFFIFLTFGSLFMTLYQSQFIWNVFSPILSLVQFPWRFIAFSLVGISFLSGIFIDAIKIPYKTIGIVAIVFLLFITTSKYFYKPPMSKNDFEKKYLSETYIEQKVAYDVAEYLPKTANYTVWRGIEKTGPAFDYRLPAESSPPTIQILKNQPFEKEFFSYAPVTLSLNIHYFPFWNISINNKTIKPDKFDQLGRPVLVITEPSTIRIEYDETIPEKTGDAITVLALLGIVIIITSKKIWNSINT